MIKKLFSKFGKSYNSSQASSDTRCFLDRDPSTFIGKLAIIWDAEVAQNEVFFSEMGASPKMAYPNNEQEELASFAGLLAEILQEPVREVGTGGWKLEYVEKPHYNEPYVLAFKLLVIAAVYRIVEQSGKDFDLQKALLESSINKLILDESERLKNAQIALKFYNLILSEPEKTNQWRGNLAKLIELFVTKWERNEKDAELLTLFGNHFESLLSSIEHH